MKYIKLGHQIQRWDQSTPIDETLEDSPHTVTGFV